MWFFRLWGIVDTFCFIKKFELHARTKKRIIYWGNVDANHDSAAFIIFQSCFDYYTLTHLKTKVTLVCVNADRRSIIHSDITVTHRKY